MTLYFTDEEYEWLVMEPFNWHVKEGAPKEIKESLESKLSHGKTEEDKLVDKMCWELVNKKITYEEALKKYGGA